jgi:hypothetical protein
MKKIKKKKIKKKKIKKTDADSRMVKITSPINPDLIIPVLSERADDSIIESDVVGKAMDYYVYEFPLEGKVVRGLTVKGVIETVRYININTKKTHMRLVVDKNSLKKEECSREEQKGIEVTIWVDDMISGQSYPGVKFEAYKKYSRKNKAWYPNTFATEKATSKAIRNAFRRHFPEHLVQSVIAKMVKDKSKVLSLTSAPEIEATELEEVKLVELKPTSNLTNFEIARNGVSKLTTEFDLKKAIEIADKGIPGFDKSQNLTYLSMLKTKLNMLKKK